jgi:hypothetical protein
MRHTTTVPTGHRAAGACACAVLLPEGTSIVGSSQCRAVSPTLRIGGVCVLCVAIVRTCVDPYLIQRSWRQNCNLYSLWPLYTTITSISTDWYGTFAQDPEAMLMRDLHLHAGHRQRHATWLAEFWPTNGAADVALMDGRSGWARAPPPPDAARARGLAGLHACSIDHGHVAGRFLGQGAIWRSRLSRGSACRTGTTGTRRAILCVGTVLCEWCCMPPSRAHAALTEGGLHSTAPTHYVRQSLL